MPQIQIHEILPGGRYAVASHLGPSYTGPISRLGFVDGVLDTVDGYRVEFATGLQLQGAVTLISVFEYEEGVRPVWDDGAGWCYVQAEPPPPPAPPAKPKKRRRGKVQRNT